jgi:hypothetical protein
MNGKIITDIISWTILAALAVLVVMNADKVAVAVTSVGGFWVTETGMFTGSGYGQRGYGQLQK